MTYDLKRVPLTAKGAYLNIFQREDNLGGGIWIKSLIRSTWGEIGKVKPSNLLLKIIPTEIDGTFCEFEVASYPSHIHFKINNGSIKVFINKYNTLKFIIENAGIVFEYQNNNDINLKDLKNNKLTIDYPLTNQFVEIKSLNQEIKYYENDRRILINNTKENEILVSFWVNDLEHPKKHLEFKEIEDVEVEINKFISNYEPKTAFDKISLYSLWALSYEAVGNYQTRAIAISMNDMSLTWGWDHLLIGTALVHSDSSLIKEAIDVFFYHQLENGMLPDAINPVLIVDKFTKPPVYGYYLSKMHEKGLTFSADYQKYLYEKLTKLTNWWTKEEEMVPKYEHPFDSGWDNATCFDKGVKFITPDLVSYVILQFDYLKELANNLGKNEESKRWESRRNQLLENFIKHFWDGKEFLYDVDGVKNKTTSLIRMIPIILGNLLPEEVKTILIEELKVENHFLSPGGLASESLKSKLYDTRLGDRLKPNAYWRGPLWSPPIFMIIDGLNKLNEGELSSKITERYLNVIEKSGGFFENYDAVNKAGYDDIGYGWTISTYVLLRKLDNKAN